MRVIEGKLVGQAMRFGIIASRFNSFITERLLDGALNGLRRHGADEDSVDVVWVPGAFEISFFAHKMAASEKYDALICLGAVIRGDTPHFDYICGEVSRGVGHAMNQYGVPIAFGVLTTNTVEQAVDRAGAKMGNKGFEAAVTAIEMASLNKELS
jgi:6,7-dimethyl-8-ribityllumazine synthase